MNKIFSFILRLKSVWAYIFFGVCTTAVNVVSYWLCSKVLGILNIPAVIIAWLVAVTFAFFTNKLWVFGSKSMCKQILLYELWTFYTCRLFTGVVDIVIMYIAVDLMARDAVLWKALADFIIIVVNFIASKYIIFIRKDENKVE